VHRSHTIFGMTSIEPGSEILKTDKRGRVWRSREQREQLLEEFERSGLSGPKFASLTGLKYQTLAGWLHKRREPRTQMTAVASASCRTPSQWFETVIDKTPSGASSALIVRLPSGAAIEVMAPGQVEIAAAVLRAWENAVC
jgi:hypothetical protein